MGLPGGAASPYRYFDGRGACRAGRGRRQGGHHRGPYHDRKRLQGTTGGHPEAQHPATRCLRWRGSLPGRLHRRARILCAPGRTHPRCNPRSRCANENPLPSVSAHRREGAEPGLPVRQHPWSSSGPTRVRRRPGSPKPPRLASIPQEKAPGLGRNPVRAGARVACGLHTCIGTPNTRPVLLGVCGVLFYRRPLLGLPPHPPSGEHGTGKAPRTVGSGWVIRAVAEPKESPEMVDAEWCEARLQPCEPGGKR